MLGFIVLIIAAGLLVRQLLAIKPASDAPHPNSLRLQQAEQYAARLFQEKRYPVAERAYLNILKLDHRNIKAYTHLGIIYSIQRNFADAIESFELATRFGPSAATYQHLGLAYLEHKRYIKSIAAYEKSIMFEPSALRYAGLSRAFDKLSNGQKAIETAQRVVELDPSPKNQTALAALYVHYGQPDQAAEVRQRLKAG